MGRFQRHKSHRVRVGLVSYYQHHRSWYLYYRQADGKSVSASMATSTNAATAAARLNAQLLGLTVLPTPATTTAAPIVAAAPVTGPVIADPKVEFKPIMIAQLRAAFLDHHEYVLCSSLATVARYRTATKYLEAFTGGTGVAHEVSGETFLRYLRTLRVAANGHPHSARRPLRDKGVRYILEVARGMYRFAAKRRHLPPYAENPFSELTSKRVKVNDSKSVFVFDQQSELAFLSAADHWSFPIHLMLAKTGMRPGELVHLLVEDLDLDGGWVHIRNKPELGWRIKTGRDRRIPLVSEVVAVLRRTVANRQSGPVFVRTKYGARPGRLSLANRKFLAARLHSTVAALERSLGRPLTRQEEAQAARRLWHEAGVIKTDRIRLSFIRVASKTGLSDATCPKSWRHTFATLLQDANVDPLLRQITLGHSPPLTPIGALGMSGVYSHSRPETQKAEIERAMRLWPSSLQLAAARATMPAKIN